MREYTSKQGENMQAEKEPLELVIAPVFQRKDVWKLEQKRELVESVLMNIPIPVVYLLQTVPCRKF